jgi:hypothetical protein
MCLAAWLFWGLASMMAATVAVPAWRQRWSGTGTDAVLPVAARELVDGSNLVIAASGAGIVAQRFDHDGHALSSAFLSTPYSMFDRHDSLAAIDGWGGVFVSGRSPGSQANPGHSIWLMKYDGASGRALWAAPAIKLSGLSDDELAVDLLVDNKGDLVVVGLISGFSNYLFKVDGARGQILWGPLYIEPQAWALAPDGDLLIASIVSSTGVNQILRISGSSGQTLWGPISLTGPQGNGSPTVLGSGRDGTFVLATATLSGVNLLKFDDADGSLLWGPVKFEPGPTYPNAAVARVLRVTVSGDLLVAGTVSGQFFLLKYSGPTGNLLWGPVQGPPGSDGEHLSLDLAESDDSVVVAWVSGQGANGLTSWKYDASGGTALWGPVVLAGATADSQVAPASYVASNGRVAIACAAPTGLAFVEQDGATGSPAWAPTFQTITTGIFSTLVDLSQDRSGNVVVTGYALPNEQSLGGNSSIVTFKYDRSTGAPLWGPVLYDTATPFGNPVMVRTDSLGNVLVAGRATGTVILKYASASGALAWSSTLPNFFVVRMAVDNAGNVFVVGSSGNAYDIETYKVSGVNGAILWGPVIYSSGAGALDFAAAAAVTTSGDVIVSGDSTTPGSSNAVWVTLKYAGVSGAVLWGPVNSTQCYTGDCVEDIAVDGSGDVFIAGGTLNDYRSAMATAKLNGKTGATLWGPAIVTGSGNYFDIGSALAIDSHGDVLTTGSVVTSANNSDYATIKYRGSDGSVIWGPRLFDGSGQWDDFAWGIALDSSNNPVVAGTSTNPSFTEDAVLIKYDGGTGATLWGPVTAGSVDMTPLHNLSVRGQSAVVAMTSSRSFLTAAYDESFRIGILPEDMPPAYCDVVFHQALSAGNGSAPYSWTVASGSLPPGLALDGATGSLTGTPSATGTFDFSVRVVDTGSLASQDDFEMTVLPGEGLPIRAATTLSCPEGFVTLSVDSAYASYQWLPGGETSATIVVSPSAPTTYGLVVTDSSGCTLQGSVRIDPRLLCPRGPVVRGPSRPHTAHP